MTIHLCIDARMAFSSGIGTCIRALVPRFNQLPFCLTLLVSEKNQSWCNGIAQILCSTPIYSIKEQIALAKTIPPCDLFWSPHYNIPLLPNRASKQVTTIHDACHLALQQSLSLPQKIYAKLVMRLALHRSDATTTVSNFSQNELIRYLGSPKQPIKVIAPGVDSAQHRKITDPHLLANVRTKYKLSNPFIMFVGNLKPHKNLDGLIQAFEQAALPGWDLVIVGKGREFKPPPRDRILMLGEVPEFDLPVLYSLASIFVFPSFYEGFGLPPLEAMGCGCPTIVSKTASLPEVCGDASLYIDPRDPSDLAHALRKLAKEPSLREELIEKGFSQIQKYSWDKTGAEYRDLFKKVHDA